MLSALEHRAVFNAAGTDYTWGDVVLAARMWGDWAKVAERAGQELTLLDQGGSGLMVSEDAVQSAANEFRYERDLVSAEEMEEWLVRWALDSETWMEWMWADLMLRNRPDAPASAGVGTELEQAIHAESVCSGALSRLAIRLAGRAAIHEKLAGPAATADRPAMVAALEESYRRFREEIVTEAALETRVRMHQADWTRVLSRALSFGNAEAAREALMTMREDALSLEEVATDAHARVEPRELLLEEIDEAYRHHLLSARPGDLVGPLRGSGKEGGETYTLFLVEEKVPPSVDDERIVERAEASLLQGMVGREVDDRVRWRWKL